MASASTSCKEQYDSSSTKQGIPRVISMAVGASSAIKSALLPLQKTSSDHNNKGGVANTTASAATSATAFDYPSKVISTSSVVDSGENAVSGRWSTEEHQAFLSGLKVYGREWKKVATCIPTRTPAQIRSHAQKYFNKVSKEQQEMVALEETPDLSCHEKLMQCASRDKMAISSSYPTFFEALTQNPASAEARVKITLQSLHKRKAELESRLRRIKSETLPTKWTHATSASMGPASIALKTEQQHLRKAAKARYDMKKNRAHSVKAAVPIAGNSCAGVSLSTMPSSGEFDSGEVLALSLLGDSFKKRRREKIPQQPVFKSRRTEH